MARIASAPIAVLLAWGLAVTAPAAGQPAAFEPPAFYPVGAAPLDIAAGDLNGDGVPDLVTANETDESVSVLLGGGDGTFGPAASTGIPFEVSSVSTIALGDVDGDGDLDVVGAGFSDAVVALFNAGDGTLPASLVSEFGTFPETVSAIDLADLDGDGDLDLLMLDGEGLSVHDGNSAGDFVTSADLPFSAGFQAGLAVGDFDGDGAPDVAASDGVGTVLVALNDGAGALQTPTPYALPSGAAGLVAADLDGDGDLDLATTSGALLNDGAGAFAVSQTGFGLTTSPLYVDAADFNLDGAVDLAITDNSDQVIVVRGLGDGTFLPAETYAIPFSNGGAWALTAEDLDGDGRPDLAVTPSTEVDSQVAVLLNTPVVNPPLFLPVTERIGVVDEPRLRPALFLPVNETVFVADEPRPLPALFLPVSETIRVWDDPDATAALFLPVREWITVWDEVGTLLGFEGLADAFEALVAEYVADGTLTRGQGGSLLQKLVQVRRAAERGQYVTALNVLVAIVDQIESFRTDGVLTDEEADALVALAEALATALEQEQAQSRLVASAEAALAQALPEAFALDPAFPNPFSRAATVPYALPEAARVRLDLYDALGRRVAVLVDREQPAGYYAVQLRAGALASGTYIVRLEAGPFTASGTVQVQR